MAGPPDVTNAEAYFPSASCRTAFATYNPFATVIAAVCQDSIADYGLGWSISSRW